MDVRSGKCFKCGNFGHLARFCRSLILIRGEETGSISNQIRERSPRRTFSRPPPPSRRQHYEPRNLEHQHGLYGYEYFEERSHPQQHYGHYDYAYSEYDYRQYDDRRLRERREYFDNADYYDRYPPRRDYDLSSDFGIRKGERNIGVNPDGNKYPHLYEYGLDSYPKR